MHAAPLVGFTWFKRCCETLAPDRIAHHICRLMHSSKLHEGAGKTHFSAEEGEISITELPTPPITMDKQPTVVFRNVGQLYFPQTSVECHYSLTTEHRWSNGDWIGIFRMGWSSVKQYYTYTWALVPEGYTERTSANCCAHFYACYLPRPSAVEYQFVYVDKMGRVCARSRPFTFCAPKPLEELETLKEEQEEGDGEEELLLVIPRAQLLQTQLEESSQKQADLQQALDVARKEIEIGQRNRMEWEIERDALKEEITELRDNLRHSGEMLKALEEKHEDVKYNTENLSSDVSKLMAENTENQEQIKDLEDDIKVLTDREKEANNEHERLKDRVKKMSSQMKHDEEKRKSLQMEAEASLAEVRGLQERLEASDHAAESLRRELRELGTCQSNTHAELHQTRLQVAQLTLQLSEADLALREERANSALEREAYRHAAETDKKKFQDLTCELQRKEEWLHEERMERDNLEAELGREKVLLCDARRELQELKASLRKAQREREEDVLDKLDLVNYVRQLEQRLGIVPQTKPSCFSPSSEGDEDAPPASPRSIASPLFLSDHLEQPDGAETPTETHVQGRRDDTGFNPQDKRKHRCETRAGGEKQLIIPELVNPVLSELADSPMW